MTCSAPDCARPVVAKGLCATHYQAARRAKQAPGKASRPKSLGGSTQVTVRLPTSLVQHAERCAEARGESLSTWLRKAIHGAALRDTLTPPLRPGPQ